MKANEGLKLPFQQKKKFQTTADIETKSTLEQG